MLGGYISDLEVGDEFEPVRFTLSALMASEYAHAMEENHEWFHSGVPPFGRQVRMPTVVHCDKMMLLEANCLKERRLSGEKAADARIHYEYDAHHHTPAYVGEELILSGRIIEKYTKKGRDYIRYEIEVHAGDGRLVTTYTDRTLLRYARDTDLPEKAGEQK